MAKFQTKIKADLEHLMEYVHNSLKPDNLPADFLGTEIREYDDVKIIVKRYVAYTPTMVIFTSKTDSSYINVDILNTGQMTSRWTIEDGGEPYEQYLADMFNAYNPQASSAENRYTAPLNKKNFRESNEPFLYILFRTLLKIFFRNI